ncbi:pyrroloquinoline quinone biosynthesis protein PqqB [Allopusillimonas ginsengisoli]|uniref:pyrroloquinoline quinone biosynthesis protein PqqB n=1 Tax=Allopusillimonas ginsengisoli TaxID=453575 RepID=UPI0039C3098C
MKLKILGSAAGGGFPQWNCNCPNCDGIRRGTIKAQARTQSSLAISVNGDDWLLINASPDILAQIRSNPSLQPARTVRDTGIAAVLVTDAQIDHVTGLLMLRERGTPLPLYTTESVFRDLSTGFPITSILSHYCGVEHHPIPLDGSAMQIDVLPGVSVTAIPLRSKAPPYSPNRQAPTQGDNIGLFIKNTQSDASVFYAPGLGQPEPHVIAAMNRANTVLVDGTLWHDDEMIQLGLSAKTSQDMGHLALCGSGGMIDVLNGLDTRSHSIRKVLVHINNTNPVLRDDSVERATLVANGIEVATDGMTFEL